MRFVRELDFRPRGPAGKEADKKKPRPGRPGFQCEPEFAIIYICLHAFDDRGDPHAAPDAERGQSVSGLATFQFVHGGSQ